MRVTSNRVRTLQARADKAALAVRARRAKQRGPLTNAERVEILCSMVERVEAEGGAQHLDLLALTGKRLETEPGDRAPIYAIVGLHSALSAPALLPHVGALLDGTLPLDDEWERGENGLRAVVRRGFFHLLGELKQ